MLSKVRFKFLGLLEGSKMITMDTDEHFSSPVDFFSELKNWFELPFEVEFD